MLLGRSSTRIPTIWQEELGKGGEGGDGGQIPAVCAAENSNGEATQEYFAYWLYDCMYIHVHGIKYL